MKSSRALLLSTMLVLAASSLAAAGPKPKPPTVEEKAARAHFDKGRELFSFGAYDEAIRSYEAAYALMPLPDILFNIAQVYRTKGDKPKALEYYRRYLAAAPSGQAAEVTLAHVAAIEAEMKAEALAAEAKRKADEDAARERAAADEQRRREDEARAQATAQRAAEEVAQERVAEVEANRRQSTGRTLRNAGLTSAGVGALTVGAGLYFGMRASSLSDEVSAAMGTWTDDLDQKVRDADAAERKMYLFTAAGGVAVLGGGVLYVLGARMGRAGETPRVTLAPVHVRGGSGLALGGSF